MRRLCHQAVPKGVIRSFLVAPIAEGWREEKAAVLGGFEHSRDKRKHVNVQYCICTCDMTCHAWRRSVDSFVNHIASLSRASFLGAFAKREHRPWSGSLEAIGNLIIVELSSYAKVKWLVFLRWFPPDAQIAHWNILLTISSGAGFCTSTVGYLRIFIIVMAWRKECHTRSKIHPKHNFKNQATSRRNPLPVHAHE